MEETPTLYAILLGAVQGITEFLPISSSGHLIIISKLTDGKTLPLSLNVALHLGTLSAVLVYFWRDWLGLAKALVRRIRHGTRSFESDTLLPIILIGSVPAGLVGLTLRQAIERFLHSPSVVILPLALVGVAMWWFDKTCPSKRDMRDLTLKDGLWIGIAQATALIPGVSRSGSTILCGRVLGMRREAAARFSFLLGTPAMAGAALVTADELIASFTEQAFGWGFLSSVIVGGLSIAFLLRFLRSYGLGIFALYRVILAAILAVILFSW